MVDRAPGFVGAVDKRPRFVIGPERSEPRSRRNEFVQFQRLSIEHQEDRCPTTR